MAPDIDDFLTQWKSDVVDAKATVELKPALVLRKRGAAALLEVYETMIAAVRDIEPEVPIGLAQLVEPVESSERVARLAASGAMTADELVEDALYPLASNVEQRDILGAAGPGLRCRRRGPAGTGKTHTIANLMSALLAKGQRVLVVSEKAQALHVLRDKMPEELRQLAVSITEVTKDGWRR